MSDCVGMFKLGDETFTFDDMISASERLKDELGYEDAPVDPDLLLRFALEHRAKRLREIGIDPIDGGRYMSRRRSHNNYQYSHQYTGEFPGCPICSKQMDRTGGQIRTTPSHASRPGYWSQFACSKCLIVIRLPDDMIHHLANLINMSGHAMPADDRAGAHAHSP